MFSLSVTFWYIHSCSTNIFCTCKIMEITPLSKMKKGKKSINAQHTYVSKVQVTKTSAAYFVTCCAQQLTILLSLTPTLDIQLSEMNPKCILFFATSTRVLGVFNQSDWYPSLRLAWELTRRWDLAWLTIFLDVPSIKLIGFVLRSGSRRLSAIRGIGT